jgi:hypothetical protein
MKMSKSVNVAALMAIAGGLAVATVPTVAFASGTCSAHMKKCCAAKPSASKNCAAKPCAAKPSKKKKPTKKRARR